MKKRMEQDQARALYQGGKTYNEIARILDASKSTISLWCRDLVAEKRMAELTKRKVDVAGKERKSRIRVLAKPPFGDYYIYSYPEAGGATRIQMVHRTNKSRLGMTLARYQMCLHMGRILGRDEMVQYRTDDLTNNEITNLKIVLRNAKGPKETPKQYTNECVICEEAFSAKKATVETCSKVCKYILISGVIKNQAAEKKLRAVA